MCDPAQRRRRKSRRSPTPARDARRPLQAAANASDAGRTATICAYEARWTEAPATGSGSSSFSFGLAGTHAGFWKLMRPAVRPKITPASRGKSRPRARTVGEAKAVSERQSTTIMQWVRASQSYEQRRWLASSPALAAGPRVRRRGRGQRSLRCCCGRSTRCPSSGAESRGGAR